MTDAKPYHHRFSLGYRDMQEVPHQRSIQASPETLREWRIKFGFLCVPS